MSHSAETGSPTLLLAGIILLLMLAGVSEWWMDIRRYFGLDTEQHEIEDEEDGE